MAAIQIKVVAKEEQLLGTIATYIFTMQPVSATESGNFEIRSTDPDLFNFFTVGTTYTTVFTAV